MSGISGGSKSAFVAITGRPNAGKSTLLNLLVGEKIAAVTSKPQTTRTRITGIVTKGETQFVFIDTPGVHKAKNRLGEHMNRAAEASASGADLIILVADITAKAGEAERRIAAGFTGGQKAALLLNKIDLAADRALIAARIGEYSRLYDFDAVIPVSLLKKDGLGLIWGEIEKHAVSSPHYFPDDQLTDRSERVLAGEIIREKILICMRDEVPHGVAVSVERMSERESSSGAGVLDIFSVIYCERDSHKGMLIGKNGLTLRKIGERARRELERFFEIKVNLQCRVKVSENWRDKEARLRDFGLAGD